MLACDDCTAHRSSDYRHLQPFLLIALGTFLSIMEQ